MRKVVRRGKGAEEDEGGELQMEGSFSEGLLEGDNEQYVSYAVLGHDSKVGL